MSTVSPGSTASLSSFCSVSPPPAPAWPAPEQREPLSLVVAKEQAATPTTATKHWKKSISRSYSSCPSPGPVSPSTSTTAEALLSLAQLPAPRVLPVAVAPTRPAVRPPADRLEDLQTWRPYHKCTSEQTVRDCTPSFCKSVLFANSPPVTDTILLCSKSHLPAQQ